MAATKVVRNYTPIFSPLYTYSESMKRRFSMLYEPFKQTFVYFICLQNIPNQNNGSPSKAYKIIFGQKGRILSGWLVVHYLLLREDSQEQYLTFHCIAFPNTTSPLRYKGFLQFLKDKNLQTHAHKMIGLS